MNTAESRSRKVLMSWLLAGSAIGLATLAVPAVAQSQPASFSQGSMKLDRSIQGIERHFGVKLSFEREDVGDAQGRPVRDAATAIDAVIQATEGTGLSYEAGTDGTLRIFRRANSGAEILVIATRDEAETNLNVNSAASSTRTGKSLREQPRATTVVTAKLMEDQQVQSVQEALRNVSGTTATGNTQGMAAFTVRGYNADAIINGLRGSPGGAQPVAGLERIEVLKGPDVVLVGSDNLGGIVNIVTKRPSARRLLNVTAEYGSFDDKKITVDASNALNEARSFSARLVASAAGAERSYQGYSGREEYLVAPSVRYKTAASDFVIGMSSSDIFTPALAVTSIDQNVSDQQVIRAVRRTPLGNPDQGVGVGVTRGYFDFSQKVADWLTLVARGEHAKTTQDLGLYLPLFAVSPTSFLYLPNVQRTKTKNDAIDSYARLNFNTGQIENTLTVGANYSRATQLVLNPLDSAPFYAFDVVNGDAIDFFTGAPVTDFPPLPIAQDPSYSIPTSQTGIYIQDFVVVGPVTLVAAVRFNRYRTGISFVDPNFAQFNSVDHYKSTLPSFGAVLDVTPTFSLYANYQKGYQPGGTNFYPDSAVPGAYQGRLFPDSNTNSLEGGVKFDLLDRSLAVVAAIYRNRQSNLVDYASVPGAAFLVPGQQGTGFELDVTGQIMSGWFVAASFSRAKFEYLEPTPDLIEVVGQPKTKYSLFTGYEQPTGRWKGWGGSIGVFGNSRSFIYGGPIDPANGLAAYDGATYRPFVPGGRQVDANVYLTSGPARFTLGVKNLFDRINYNTTRVAEFIPISEPRTFRASLSFRFY